MTYSTSAVRLSWTWLAIAACSAQLPVGASTNATMAHRASVERGRDIADRNCSLCHAIGAAGDSRHPSAPPFNRLVGRGYRLDDLPSTLAAPSSGHRGMPLIDLAPQELADLRAYLQTFEVTELPVPAGEEPVKHLR